MANPTNLIGAALPRKDGPDKVKGSTPYPIDAVVPGMLYGRSLRSPVPHGRIARLDTSRAAALPGVHAVLTGADTAGIRVGRQIMDMPVLAEDVVRFVGDRVAAVAAETVDIADAALALIDIEFEELTAVFDVTLALAANAPLLHPDVNSYSGLPSLVDANSNVHLKRGWLVGDPDAAFAASDIIVEATYETARTHQGYLEPHSCTVWHDEDGRTHILASNKAPYRVRRNLADSLGIPIEQLLFHPVVLGGDFGGKAPLMDIPVAYFLSKQSGKPVKMSMTYSEELTAAGPRHSSRIRLRTALATDGRPLAHEAHVLFNSGAYAGNRQSGVGELPDSRSVAGPYKIPNTRVDVDYVYTNVTPGGFMRAPGGTQTIFAFESHIDTIARHIGMDPADYRLRFLIDEGDSTPLGEVYRELRGKEILQMALDASGYRSSKPTNVGRGIAVGSRTGGPGETDAGVQLNPDGTIETLTSIFEQGGGTYQALMQIAAQQLNVPMGLMRVSVLNTDEGIFDSGVGASRSMRLASPAIHQAAIEAKAKLAAVVAEVLGWPEETVTLEGSDVVRIDSGERHPWADVLTRTGSPITARIHTKDVGEASYTAFTAQIAEVSVDTETGQVTLLKFTTVQDTGTVINPMGHKGQIYGGVVQGIGLALTEELILDNGRVTNASLADYKMPNLLDVPELRIVVSPSDGGTGPIKVKEIGEGPFAPVAPAIANAIEDAVGVRVRQMPIRAEDVLALLRAKS